MTNTTPKNCARCQAERFPQAALNENGGEALTAPHADTEDCTPILCMGCEEPMHISEWSSHDYCGTCQNHLNN